MERICPSARLTARPTITQELLTNPGIGFIAAPPLMGDPEVVRDNRGEPVEKYRFSSDSKTWNHPDSGVYYSGVRWKDIEPEEGVYRWEELDRKLERCRELGCLSVVRAAPYALAEADDIPAWLRARWPDYPEFPFWKIDPNQTEYAECWARFIRAFGQRYDGNPLIASVDMALVGAWGEGGGSELVESGRLDQIIRAYIEGFRITPLQMLLHDPVSVGCIRKYRAAVGFRVDCLGDMGGFHGSEWSHMLDFYPENIQNFDMGDAWEKAPVVFEACWHMNDWYKAGWDIDYIIDESLKWHISSYNSKATTVPLAWRNSVAGWVRRMGYRYELRQLRAGGDWRPGGRLDAELLLANVGVAPCYQRYPLVLLLTGAGGEYRFVFDEDIRRWMPGEDVLAEQSFALPAGMPPGEYQLRIGIETPLPELGTLRLAIEGRDEQGYYPMGRICVES